VILVEGFGAIIGHEEVIRHLQNAIAKDKVSHAYIFAGEPGAGKKLLATTFAMTLQCEEKGTDPCLKCESCKRALNKNHPDIISVVHEKPASISIEEIRRQVVDDVAIKPYRGPYKIYLINDADKMTPQAQNALLKTIEEPPAYAVILLLTNNVDGLLPTIQSRCIRLDLKAVQDSLVKNYLMERLHIPDYQAEVDASFAQGNIGKAEQAATSEEFAEMTRNVLQLLKYVNDMEVYELVDAMKELAPDKDNVYDYLDLFLLWFRDVLMFKATRDVDNLVFKQEINMIKDQARERSYEGLEKILDAVEKAKTRLRANVNFDLVMELLFLTIREK
jgi:DNA polymerase-3 subunit delta'